MSFATVTSEGQITVPEEVRTRFDLHAGDRLEFIWIDDELRVRPASKKVSEVFGKYKRKGQITLSTEEMDDTIRSHLRENF